MNEFPSFDFSETNAYQSKSNKDCALGGQHLGRYLFLLSKLEQPFKNEQSTL